MPAFASATKDWKGDTINNGADNLSKYECDKALGYDAMISDQIKETTRVYDEEWERVRQQGLSAFLLGAGRRSTNAGALAAGGAASQPYEDRMNQLISERNVKINELRYQQKKLRFENSKCYP
jgi:hypothetical protein